MTTEQKRAALLAVYPGPRWADKVKKMPDTQVFVIYTKFVNEKKI